MNTVIVPVDFSVTSIHAAKYALQLLTGHKGINLLLYHSYSKVSEEAGVQGDLEKLREELLHNTNLDIEIMAHQADDVVEGLEKAVRHRRADLVIMGISGKSAIEQVIYGSNTLRMAKTKACPVMIIPEEAPFNPISKVMLTSDFKNTLQTTPSVPIKNFLDLFKPKLHIVNVDKHHYISLTDDYERERQDLIRLFADYNPDFHFLRLYDVDEALNLFAHDMHIDLIITIQKNHSFMEKLFRTSHTRKLSFHSKVPILIIHE